VQVKQIVTMRQIGGVQKSTKKFKCEKKTADHRWCCPRSMSWRCVDLHHSSALLRMSLYKQNKWTNHIHQWSTAYYKSKNLGPFFALKFRGWLIHVS